MPNIGNIIKNHNNTVLNDETKEVQKPCNCRNKDNCPLNGDCQITSIVYKAEITSASSSNFYYGLCEGSFKKRYYNHKKSFEHVEYRNETELSKQVWKLKEANKEFEIAWSIAARATPFNGYSTRCDLCLTEKAIIVRAPSRGLLNKRTELISRCRHRNKFLLKSIK